MSNNTFHNNGASDHGLPEDEELRLALGLPAELPLEDGPGPRAVDVEQLRALHRGALDDTLTHEVRNLTSKYREWHDAERDVLLDELGDAGLSKERAAD